ncbi:MAG TPA: hypothetical protein EYG67_04090 [Campylobacterales bacterium]|nr:hypothetical protein [Campylobacterales bacterium]HIP41174.1 hypothetical protein [Campylobacterales bacterium]
MDEIEIELKRDKLESLELYAKLLKKDINTMLDEALEQYFINEQEKLIAKEQNATNLSYDEFWDGVDV